MDLESRPQAFPTLSLFDQQGRHAVDLSGLTEIADRALPLVWKHPGPEPSALIQLQEIEITFVDDETISVVHGEFLNDPTPTDVITFHHGEILISADTAWRQAQEHHETWRRELALYVIHGLLHLHGHEDHTVAGAETMRRIQNEVLTTVA